MGREQKDKEIATEKDSIGGVIEERDRAFRLEESRFQIHVHESVSHIRCCICANVL